MKRLSQALTGLGVFVALTLLAGSAGATLLNPGFENGSGTTADNWTSFGNALRLTDYPMTGSYSEKMYGNFDVNGNLSGAFQDMAAVPGETFVASVYLATADFNPIQGANQAFMKLEFLDGTHTSFWSSPALNPLTASSPVDTWILETVTGTAPVGTVYTRVSLLFEQNIKTDGGSAFFDNATLDVVPEPSTVLLLLMGGLTLYGGHRRLGARRSVRGG